MDPTCRLLTSELRNESTSTPKVEIVLLLRCICTVTCGPPFHESPHSYLKTELRDRLCGDRDFEKYLLCDVRTEGVENTSAHVLSLTNQSCIRL